MDDSKPNQLLRVGPGVLVFFRADPRYNPQGPRFNLGQVQQHVIPFHLAARCRGAGEDVRNLWQTYIYIYGKIYETWMKNGWKHRKDGWKWMETSEAWMKYGWKHRKCEDTHRKDRRNIAQLGSEVFFRIKVWLLMLRLGWEKKWNMFQQFQFNEDSFHGLSMSILCHLDVIICLDPGILKIGLSEEWIYRDIFILHVWTHLFFIVANHHRISSLMAYLSEKIKHHWHQCTYGFPPRRCNPLSTTSRSKARSSRIKIVQQTGFAQAVPWETACQHKHWSYLQSLEPLHL